MNKKNKFSPSTEQLLTKMGLDPNQIRRESSYEVMAPKMAMVGFLDTIVRFSETLKGSLINSVSGATPSQVRLYLTALRGSLDMCEASLLAYESEIHKAMAKDAINTFVQSLRKPSQEKKSPFADEEEEEQAEDGMSASTEDMDQYRKEVAHDPMNGDEDPDGEEFPEDGRWTHGKKTIH